MVFGVSRCHPFVAESGVDLHHLEEMRAIHNVAAKVDTSPTKFSAHGFQEFGRNQSGERQFCIQSEFVGVEVAAVFPRFDFSDLPFVCEVGFDGESFGAAEEVAMSHGKRQARTEITV